MTVLNNEYLKLLESPRASPQTKSVLFSRIAPDDPSYTPSALTVEELLTLRHVLSRVIPQKEFEIDLAARLDRQLADGVGDGWRYSSLPSDADACRVGLSLLDEFAMKLSAVPFGRLAPEAQDSLLEATAAGRLHSPKLDLKRWFEDLRAGATQLYVAHPVTLARMGYSGDSRRSERLRADWYRRT